MPQIKKSLQHLQEKHRKKINVIRFAVSAGLTLFDVISDLVLAANYFKNGDNGWGALTLVFFIFPFVVGIFIIVVVSAKMLNCCGQENFEGAVDVYYGYWIFWKILECIVEAGPQLILQLYIMALPSDPDPFNATGENRNLEVRFIYS